MELVRARGRVAVVIGTLAVLVLASAACASRGQPREMGEGSVPRSPSSSALPALDPASAMRSVGLIVQDRPLPFVGAVRFLRARSPDSTLVLVALSLANRALTFTRTGSVQRAVYGVGLSFSREGAAPWRSDAREIVRVQRFRETARTDPSIVFQQFATLAPGDYTLDIEVRDEGGGKRSTRRVPVTVPRLAAGVPAVPLLARRATPRGALDSLPPVVANARATAVIGRDSIAPVYLEGYGLPAGASFVVRVREASGRLTWEDTVRAAVHGALASAVAALPVARLGTGRLTIAARVSGTRDSASAPFLVTFDDALGAMSYEELASYLRFYATPERLRALRDTASARRAAAWAALATAADQEGEGEGGGAPRSGVRAYFARIRTAMARFREEGGPGWLTDRGKVYVTLGPPDDVLEDRGSDINERGRAQAWVYRRQHLQAVFVDETGFGWWRLTPASAAEFEQVAQRERVH